MRRIADLHAKRTAGGCDAEVLVAKATDEVKRFLRWLLLCESECVAFDLRLDGGAHLRRCTKEAIGRDAAVDALVRALEVVVLHEER